MMHHHNGLDAISTVGICQHFLGAIVVLPKGIHHVTLCDRLINGTYVIVACLRIWSADLSSVEVSSWS